MAKQSKVSGKVQNKGNGNYKVDKGNGPDEVDVDIDLHGANNYEADTLETDTLPKTMPDDPNGSPIRWFNNFSIKENGNYIKKKYTVTIGNLKEKLGKGKLVIYSETHDPNLYYLDPQPSGDSFDLDDGDPGAGGSP
jgi:hypothetical protein